MPASAESTTDPFRALGIDPAITRAVAEEGYTDPTEVQRLAIPSALAGRDLLALAQTGTGKTAAFALPILHRLHQHPRRGARAIRVLILTPTRELAIQVTDSIRAYGRHLSLKATVILGGVSAVPQIAQLRQTPDILVATPGRLLDLMGQGYIRIDQIETFVLDEADRMLDMGFIQDVRKVVAKLPARRQTLFFSATMPQEVDRLAAQILSDPVRVQATPPTSVPRQIDQKVFLVGRLEKRKLLVWLLLERKGTKRVLVFSRTKRRADTVVKFLKQQGISVAAIHSNKTQGARQTALGGFAQGKVRVLVATDIVARGIDVDDITHVVNFDLPNEPESYVHRIGRTARAGAGGTAWSFCDGDELEDLRQIERVMQRRLDLDADHPYHETSFAPLPFDERPGRRAGGSGGSGAAKKGSRESGGGGAREGGGERPPRRAPGAGGARHGARPGRRERETGRAAPAHRSRERSSPEGARSDRAPRREAHHRAPGATRSPDRERTDGERTDRERAARPHGDPGRREETSFDDNFSSGIFGPRRTKPPTGGNAPERRPAGGHPPAPRSRAPHGSGSRSGGGQGDAPRRPWGNDRRAAPGGENRPRGKRRRRRP